MKYNIIGDIHGRTCWRDLVREDCINVFVGDYFAPYERISFDKQRSIFLDIIKFKEEHPETILLLGNHDEDHWHIRERYSRFDAAHVNEITELFEDFKEMFQVAFATKDNKVLVTHAGVSVIWYVKYKFRKHPYLVNIDSSIKASSIDEAVLAYNNRYNPQFADVNKTPKDGRIYFWNNTFYLYNTNKFIVIDDSPKEIADFINNLWLSGKYEAFNFENNSDYFDCYGDSNQQSPMWIRPSSLEYSNIFVDGRATQVVGHTQFDHPCTYINGMNRLITDSVNINDIDEDSKIIHVDCLGFNPESVIYSGENFVINKA